MPRVRNIKPRVVWTLHGFVLRPISQGAIWVDFVAAAPESDRDSRINEGRNGIEAGKAAWEELERLKTEREELEHARNTIRQESDKLRATLLSAEASNAEILRSKDILEAKLLVALQEAAEIEHKSSGLQSYVPGLLQFCGGRLAVTFVSWI
jgi:hypothetical protein